MIKDRDIKYMNIVHGERVIKVRMKKRDWSKDIVICKSGKGIGILYEKITKK
jgi:hypothetical protein